MDRRLMLKGPDPREMTGCFDAAHQWIATLRAAPHGRLEMRELRYRVVGANTVPAEIWIDALKLPGKQRDAVRFQRIVDTARAAQPA